MHSRLENSTRWQVGDVTATKRILKWGQISRFLLVGFTTVGIDAVVYTLLMVSTSDPLFSKGVGFISGAVFSYFANWRFTFRNEKSKLSILMFVLVYLSSLTINILGNSVLLEALPVWYFKTALSFLIITGITTVWNYLGMALFVFNDAKRGTK